MTIRSWWEKVQERRKRLLAGRTGSGLRRSPRVHPSETDDPVAARVDLVRFGAFAEAAAELIEAGPAESARARYDEACLYFARAIEAAQRAGLTQEANRLKARRASLKRTFEAIRRLDLRNSIVRSRKPEGN